MIYRSEAALHVAPCGTMRVAWVFAMMRYFSPVVMRLCRYRVFVETQRPLR
jgi:hypothetical protein